MHSHKAQFTGPFFTIRSNSDSNTSVTKISSTASSSSNSTPTIITVSEDKAVASFNILAIAVFVTYLAHMLL